MVEFTTNLHFSLVDFNVATWHDEVNDNFRSIDALISAFTGISGLLGPWANSTTYTIGQRVIDTDLNSLWEVAIGHTSAAAGTFAADRAAHPTFWTLISPAIPNPYNVPGNFSVAGNSVFNGTVTVNNTVTMSPANKNITMSPTGTGEVIIGPTELTIAPVTNGNMDKVDIGITTPREGHFTLMTGDDLTLADDLAVAGDFDVNGAATFDGSADFDGATTIAGTSTNDNAAAGDIGEVISAQVLVGAAVALVTNTAKTVTSIALTAGDWDVRGSVGYIPAASTSMTLLAQSLSLVTNTLDQAPGKFSADQFAALVTGAVSDRKVYPSLVTRVSLSAPATVFLIAQASFTVAALSAFGIIWARRAR